MGEKKNAYTVLVGKSKGNRPFERPRHRWITYYNRPYRNRMQYMDWINLAQDRGKWWAHLDTVTSLWVH
jgi:hypothetical protein